jgi:hypothetical protein
MFKFKLNLEDIAITCVAVSFVSLITYNIIVHGVEQF